MLAGECRALRSRLFPIRVLCLGMRRESILRSLSDAEAALRARGVKHAALFGSAARGENGPESDVDILVNLDAEVVRTVLQQRILHTVHEALPKLAAVINAETR